MFIEFIGLPGSGKSTLIQAVRKHTAQWAGPALSLNAVAEAVLDKGKKRPGYLRRKSDRGWFFGALRFGHEHPEVFRVAFENTILNTPGQLDFMDLLAQYYFARRSKSLLRPVLVDEGLLHRACAMFALDSAVGDFDGYLDHVPPCDLIVSLKVDHKTALTRCRERPKGLPALYQTMSEAEVTERFDRFAALHERAVAHQARAGSEVVTLDMNGDVQTAIDALMAAITERLPRDGAPSPGAARP